MIQRTPTGIEAHCTEPAGSEASMTNPPPSWQQILARSITRPDQLLARLALPAEPWLAGASAGHQLFPIRVPEPFLARMRIGDPDDPLLKQVLPRAEETRLESGFVTDPLAENNAIQTRGLIRKYHSRALLMITGQCAVNCRYCFRRHFPYAAQRLNPEARQNVLDTLAASPEINETQRSAAKPDPASGSSAAALRI